MDEEIERLLVSVRADTGAFARDVAEMKGQIEGPLADGLERAGRVLENALLRAVRTGKIGFEDLKRVALAAMAEIAAAAIRAGIGTATRGGGGQGGLFAAAAQLLGSLLGAPGRSYWVGERGPELFVPTAGGRIETVGAGVREIRMSIAVSAPAGEAPQALARSSRQVARAVKQALMRMEE
jgi:hypothetical protein